jgi:serine/threonine-protein kinase RsbW
MRRVLIKYKKSIRVEKLLARTVLLNLMIPSDTALIGGTVGQVTDWLGNHHINIDECALFELRVILNELILNAIRHGNRGNREKNVRITAGIVECRRIFLIIEDEGDGYENTCLQKDECCTGLENMDIGSVKETGRGILIVTCLCDSIRYNKKGNKVVILKGI